jgi:hypothetical protein
MAAPNRKCLRKTALRFQERYRYRALVPARLGAGLGWLVAGPAGAVWGTAIGVLLGMLAAGAFSVFLRRANRR